MSSFKEIAENATIQSFLNCYLRETGIKTREIADGSQKTLIVPLKRQQIELSFRSITGRRREGTFSHFRFTIKQPKTSRFRSTMSRSSPSLQKNCFFSKTAGVPRMNSCSESF
jgi:siderophore synthetase component